MAKEAGFSLHAGVSTEIHQRDKLERLCRYVTRPAVSEKRLAITSNGNVRYQLKTPYRDGTTHVIFEPLDFIAKLAALVPMPRTNLTRFHGVFARGGLPHNSKFRLRVTPAKRGSGRKPTGESWLDKTPAERHAGLVKIIFEESNRCIEDTANIELSFPQISDISSALLCMVVQYGQRAPPSGVYKSIAYRCMCGF